MKIETKTIHKIDYSAWEKFVQETYGIVNTGQYHPNYSFVADVECGNDTSHEYNGITKDEANDELDREELEEWKDSNGKKQLWGARTLLLDMVSRDLIPEGDYIISVYW